jgi:uncharacterized protein YfaQ (DUF2300 family)
VALDPSSGDVLRVVEWADADAAERGIGLCNAGVVCAPAADLLRWLRALRNDNAKGEYYLTDAVALARAGWTFDAILARAYPDARLAPLGVAGRSDCERLAMVERWLAASAPRWRPRLAQEPGFEPPASVTACRLPGARPYADARRARIYVRGLASVEDRLSVVHEYLHLAFHRHPRALDEELVERLARELETMP